MPQARHSQVQTAPAAPHRAQLSPSARLGALGGNRFQKGSKWERGREVRREEQQHRDLEEGLEEEEGRRGCRLEQRPTPRDQEILPAGAEAMESPVGAAVSEELQPGEEPMAGQGQPEPR